MKKFLSLATALLLVGALSIFAGCGKGERSGVIKGNYTEPTKAELQSALDAIDTEKLLGDTEAEGWKTGMSLGANLSYEMSAAGEKMSMSFDLSHKISAESAQDALDLKGEGSLALQTNLAGEKEKYTVKTYNDMKNIYLDASAHANGENQNAKVRISIADIFDGYGDMLPIEPVGPTDAALPTDADALLKELADSGFTLAMDTSDGIKIKLTANESVFTEIIEGVNGLASLYGHSRDGRVFLFLERFLYGILSARRRGRPSEKGYRENGSGRRVRFFGTRRRGRRSARQNDDAYQRRVRTGDRRSFRFNAFRSFGLSSIQLNHRKELPARFAKMRNCAFFLHKNRRSR